MVVGITLAVAYAITTFFVYGRIRSLSEESIGRVARYTAEAVNIAGEEYLRQLDDVEPATRITLIDADGSVCYDSVEDSYTLENHLGRPEVQEALRTGMGRDLRHSDTVGRELYYCAVLLEDGRVLRVSMEASTITRTAAELLPWIAGTAVFVLILAYLAARRQAAALVRPINEIRLDNPLENDVYEELHPLLLRIDETNRAKDAVAEMRKEFSANVSHELKTPLTSISGYAEIMRDGLVKGEKITDFADRIYKEAQRMLQLVDDIMQLSRLDEGGLLQEKETVNLFELSYEIVGRLGAKARECNVRVELTGEACYVTGIRRLYDEMIFNLTENAIKYNHPGGKVTLWVGQLMNTPKVIVTDNGIGIAKDQQERIFERFYRVDKSRSKQTGGTGLGLSIVKHSVEQCGARIQVQSELGKGTRMELTFPSR